jgi:ubiquinone/menaquinone biosynthesis C-methylase UbiE
MSQRSNGIWTLAPTRMSGDTQRFRPLHMAAHLVPVGNALADGAADGETSVVATAAGRGLSWQPDKEAADDLCRQILWLDHRAADAAVRQLRDWALRALAVRPGQRVVDVGSGTGDDVRELADRVAPDGEAIGIEPNPGLRAEAARRAAGTGAQFLDATAAALPFQDAVVDAVRCERVFQHLPDAQSAAREIGRILRPGGRLVVIDMDWGTTILHPGDPAVIRQVLSAQHADLPNPFAGRQIAGQVAAAGLTVVEQTARSLIFPGTVEAVRGLPTYLARRALQRGLITPQQCDELLTVWSTAAERGDHHFSVTMFAVLARR